MSGLQNELQRSAFQDRVLAVPECFDLFLGGGRGGGKDYALALLILRHVEQYGIRARVLYLRQTYQGLADCYRSVAEELALVPNQLQATVWLHVKVTMKGERNT